MFAPFVPTLMPGELFNATHLVVPGVMGHRLRGKLLHSYLDWRDLDNQQDVIRDFRKIAAIRNSHSDIFHNNRNQTNLIDVEFTSDRDITARPYVRFLPGEKAAIVVGNNTSKDVNLKLSVPLEKIGFDKMGNFRVTDAWTGETTTMSAETVSGLVVSVPRDKSSGGGVRVFIVEPNK